MGTDFNKFQRSAFRSDANLHDALGDLGDGEQPEGGHVDVVGKEDGEVVRLQREELPGAGEEG